MLEGYKLCKGRYISLDQAPRRGIFRLPLFRDEADIFMILTNRIFEMRSTIETESHFTE